MRDINPGAGASSPQFLTNVNGTLFFGANDGTHGIELWKSDGTDAGTVLVQDIWPGPGSALPLEGLRRASSPASAALFFHADDGTLGGELWKTQEVGGPAPFPRPSRTSRAPSPTLATQ